MCYNRSSEKDDNDISLGCHRVVSMCESHLCRPSSALVLVSYKLPDLVRCLGSRAANRDEDSKFYHCLSSLSLPPSCLLLGQSISLYPENTCQGFLFQRLFCAFEHHSIALRPARLEGEPPRFNMKI